MKWPTIRLEEIASREKGSIKIGPFGSQLRRDDLQSEGVHVLGIENVLSGRFDDLGTRFISNEKFRDLAGFEIRGSDILVTMMGTIGEVAIAPAGLRTSVMDSHLLRFRPNLDLCIPEFVAWILRGPTVRRAIQSKAHGAIMKGLNSSLVRSLVLPLPPRTEQRRIVEILDQADALRKRRAVTTARAERVLPAVFTKMFGNPVCNPKGWKVVPLGELGELDRGRSKHRPRNDPSLLGGKHPFIQTGDVASSRGRIRRFKQTYTDLGLAQSRLWPAGTLCITIAANIARTGVLEFDACFPDSIVGFTPGPRVTTEFVQFLVESLRRIIERAAPQVAQKNINLELLRNLMVPVPPRSDQEKFSELASKYYKVLERQGESRERLDQLFSLLMFRALTGDLTKKWRRARIVELEEEAEYQRKTLASPGAGKEA